MSIQSLFNTTIVVRRKNVTKDVAGGQVTNYTPVVGLTDIPALIQPRHGTASRQLAQRQVIVTHVIYLEDGSAVRRGDVIYEAKTSRYFICHGVEDMAGQGRVWRIECIEEQ